MVGVTQEQAGNTSCSRGFASNCEAAECMAWRWLPLVADAKFAAAVAEVMKRKHPETGKTPAHATAAKYVGENRAEFGLPTEPTHGYCGLAGKPEA